MTTRRKHGCVTCNASNVFDTYGSDTQMSGVWDDLQKQGKTAFQALSKPVDAKVAELKTALTAILVCSAIAAATGLWSVTTRK